MKLKIPLCLTLITIGIHTGAQIYDTNGEFVQTFAGYGEQGYYDGQGIYTKFSNPSQIVADTAGNLYVWDSGNVRVRKITPGATVSTLAGGGADLDGAGTNVSFSMYYSVGAMAIDHFNTIWLVGYDGIPYLLNIQQNGWVSIENAGSGLTNLTASSGICFDSSGNLYYSGGNAIWRYSPNTDTVQPFAGNGSSGYADGNGIIFPEFNSPGALACDQANNIYAWDSGNHVIRKIDQSHNVSTFAGNQYQYNYDYADSDGPNTNVYFTSINSMFFDHSGNLYIVGGGSYYYYEGVSGEWVRKIDAQANTVTMAGNFSQVGFTNGPGNMALFNGVNGGCLSGGMIFLADENNQCIRDITFNPQPQVVSGANLRLNTYPGLTIFGAIGHTYVIQSSSDMKNWSNKATIILNSNPYLWIDENPMGSGKYYQAVLLP